MIYKSLLSSQAAIQVASLYDPRTDMALRQIDLNTIRVYLATLIRNILLLMKPEYYLHWGKLFLMVVKVYKNWVG